jgi:CxxC-x17-CxxC domain-containing protein
MMSNEGYRDRILSCRDCGKEFTFTAGEQEFFATKGLAHSPSRCPNCRAARRGGEQSSYTPRQSRSEMYDAICANCGRPTSVPFVPREDRPVYCNDCFQAQRTARPRRDEAYSYSSISHSGSNFGGGRGGRDRRDSAGGSGGRDSAGSSGGRDSAGGSGGRDSAGGSGGRDRRDRRDSAGGKRDRRSNRWDDNW